MNNPFADIIEGAKLIAAISDPDELGEVTAQLRQMVERLETRLAAMSDEPATPEPVTVEDAPESQPESQPEPQPEPRQPRVRFTGRMTPAEVRRMFNATRMAA